MQSTKKTPTRGVRCAIMLPWRCHCCAVSERRWRSRLRTDRGGSREKCTEAGGLISPRKWGEAMEMDTVIGLAGLVLFAVAVGFSFGSYKKKPPHTSNPGTVILTKNLGANRLPARHTFSESIIAQPQAFHKDKPPARIHKEGRIHAPSRRPYVHRKRLRPRSA